MMSQQLEFMMNEAIKKANELKHEYLTLENVLWALLTDDQVLAVLEHCGAKVDEIKNDLEQFILDSSNFSILSEKQIEELNQRQFVDEELRNMARKNGIIYQPEISLGLQRVLQRAAIHVQSAGKRQIKGINVLVAMFQEKESYALFLLQKQGVGRFNVVEAIAHDMDQPVNQEDESEYSEALEGEELGNRKRGERKTALEEFTVNLNNLAKNNRIDPLIGREKEVERLVQVLCRRRKNNPLLVGDAGVGKTAIAEGVSLNIVKNIVPDVLADAIIFSLDMASLLAGAKFRGDFELRLKRVCKELIKMRKSGQNPILFIDELHTVMGAGATAGGSLDASNLLKPYLSSGEIKVIGSTTHEEYRKFVEKDTAFNRRFQKIDIDEPTVEDTYRILKGLKSKFEEYHTVKYSNPVLRSAVTLSERYIMDKKLPDKAIDVIDEVGAAVQLLPKSKRKSKVSLKDIEQAVSKMAKIPLQSVIGNEKEKLKNLKQNLKLLIFGQDQAIDKLTDTILLSRSGLGNELKPMASLLFSGPTGVGKTELAKQLAFELGIQFERFDMSEYMEKHSVAKLIGAPPGYIGHDQGGVLTDAIKKSPYTVLLLDEIEKAHPDVYNILLQVMDHGKLTDSMGRTTDFKNVILIMTTNAGAKEMEAGSIGFRTSESTSSTKGDQAIKNFFTPEFRNRLDGVVKFKNLAPEFIISIVDKFLSQIDVKLAEKNVELVVSEDLKSWLAKEGYDPKMGARPIERLIHEKITQPLSKELLFGELSKGGKVELLLKDEMIELKINQKA